MVAVCVSGELLLQDEFLHFNLGSSFNLIAMILARMVLN